MILVVRSDTASSINQQCHNEYIWNL